VTRLAFSCLRAARLGIKLVRHAYWGGRTLALGHTVRWRRVAGGFEMLIDPFDFIDRSFCFGTYEAHVLRVIRAVVRLGDVCVDVGAHKGFLTLHLASAVGLRGKVLAFEPDPRAVALLRANINRNRFGQVTVYDVALGNQSGTCELVLSRQLGWSSRFPNDLAKTVASHTIVVRSRTLDEVLAEQGISPAKDCLSFMKIDAEGSEPLILEGARESLAAFKPVIHLEINRGSLAAGNLSVGSLEDLLRSLDYELYSVGMGRCWPRLRREFSARPIASLEALQGCHDVLGLPRLGLAAERARYLIPKQFSS